MVVQGLLAALLLTAAFALPLPLLLPALAILILGLLFVVVRKLGRTARHLVGRRAD